MQTDAGVEYTVFIGCSAMTPGAVEPSQYGEFQQRSIDGPFATVGTITGIAIVFDEGSDVGNRYVYLDNVRVAAGAVAHTWTSASDNGNGQTITQDPTGTDFLATLMGVPLSMLFPT